MADVKAIKKMKDGWLIDGGTFACPSCNAVMGKKLALKALGKNTIMVNSSGCMTLTATYPHTAYKIPWVHNAIENSAATASGIGMALDAKKKHRGVNIVPYSGDGATYDIGFGALSGAASRNDDMIYICYNNETFANTGFERTTATPLYAATSTTPAVKKMPGNLHFRKDMIKIMVAHNIPYAATASTAYPTDFMNKLKKASKIRGFKYIELLCPCVGWGLKEGEWIKCAQKMVHSGLWPVYEVEGKKMRVTVQPTMEHVKEALMMQGRFKHLKPRHISEIQKIVNAEWKLLKEGKLYEAVEW
ncbi:MAG: thiamine pyrophosphate-dependent enzyme [Candidatus Diapherotrites archaeon]|nr:pyruvate synthase subunit beta [Candidatus Micrarchaeota archaeon]MBU1939180.1 pyruvate synthase subunit beta [Candidatus Micrarchaeota archaeon]